MTFKKKFPVCFGCEDKKFAGHPSDIQGAREMLIKAFSDTNSWSEYKQAIRTYLEAEGCSKEHIAAQMLRVKNLANYFSDN